MASISDVLLETRPVEYSETTLRETQGLLTREGARVYLTYLFYAPLAFWMGVRSWPLFLTTVVLAGTAAAAWTWLARHPPRDGRTPFWLVLTTSGILVMLSTILGPHIIVPTVAVTNQVTDIGDVHDLHDLVALQKECAANEISEEKSAQIANMRIAIDRRPAVVHRYRRVFWMLEHFDRARFRIVELLSHRYSYSTYFKA